MAWLSSSYHGLPPKRSMTPPPLPVQATFFCGKIGKKNSDFLKEKSVPATSSCKQEAIHLFIHVQAHTCTLHLMACS